ncbi:MAG: cell division protein FtsA [Candidatus Adiutrix intracellularis]|jgi:cell division protein FtsA|nr:cell division protein FtsA [Candidatus Adiutrix intracellularis]
MAGDLIFGLDIGTTKICCVVGEPNNEGGIDIVGIGSYPSQGLRKGAVVNIERTVESIKRAVEEAELMAGCEITEVYVGIAGGHIEGRNSQGVIAIKNREVSPSDVERVLEAARALAIPMDREVIHTIPQEFIVDNQDGIQDPVGMSGVRLETKVHIVTGAATSAQNLIRCAHMADLDVCDIVLESVASADAVLTQEEKELGVALLDFGGGTVDLAIFSQNSIKHTSVLALGGTHLTNDVAVGLRTPTSSAEEIKKTYGSCLTSLVEDDQVIEVPSVGGRPSRMISRMVLADILELRVEEIMMLINRELIKSGFDDQLNSGVVITGGAALLEGIPELAEQVFDLPVRRGYPREIGGLKDVINDPKYATAVGLVLYGLKKEEVRSEKEFRRRGGTKFGHVLDRMKGWFREII